MKKKIIKKRITKPNIWKEKFIEVLKAHHVRNIDKKAVKLMAKTSNVKRSMEIRSQKYNVVCDITIEDIRQMCVESYGTACKYTGRKLLIDNMVYDHIIPVSKFGPSSKNNIQVISRFANSMKGSLTEDHFKILLNWLETVPEELKKDITIRLAHGIR